MLVQIRRALTVSDQTRLRQLVAPRQGLLPIRILERQSGQRRRQPRYRARAPHVGSLAASVGLGNQRVAQTSWTPPPLRDQRWQRPEARLEHSGTAAAVQCRRERQRKRPAEWDRWHHGSALFPIRRAGHLMGSRLEPRHSQLRRRDSRQSVLNGIPSPLSRGRRVAQALAALAQRALRPLLQVVLHPRQPACPRRARASAALEIFSTSRCHAPPVRLLSTPSCLLRGRST